MTRQKRAKLDKKGLSGLGLDKLVEILLEEASANKALKARLQAALAGEAGPAEMARLIDKRLDTHEQSKTRINNARAKDLAVEFAGLARTILSELGGLDPLAGAQRVLRFLGLRFSLSPRLVSDSARLWKVFDEAEVAAAELIRSVPAQDQVLLVPQFETLRRRDRYGEHTGFLHLLTGAISEPAANAWKATLGEAMPKEPGKFGALDLLQAIALHRRDVDGYVALEEAKAENRRDTLTVAAMLQAAGRHEQALDWARRRPTGMRLLPVNGELAAVGPEYGARERRILEAEILDKLKRRGDAQDLRWREFSETLDPVVLKLYLSKLDDFAEFDEMDRAFALVEESDDIYAALDFFVCWPKLDRAAAQVLHHKDRWEGRYYEDLAPAAEALADQQPLAATVLYRVLISDILRRGIGVAYPLAARYLKELVRLAPHLPADARLQHHDDFVDTLRRTHPKKFGFWSEVPEDLR
ncbi:MULTISPECIES: DUF6880 family protein [Alphaproteobacteria]|uniref:Uncharacterized protein n=2 Tax=Alphaproteobacteria TaxID=28211 RepID=A0A512HI75_9HYPH|nr:MULTISPECIES: DUF6880 family protein [Alphaproteobacteria]GEO85142.1 hypothetical protein RNA01_20740 [Ciceribacter naphthalenivorans]GLR24524.1 hypothetical protein GCM10007920_43180 [Ciceribacter naphthalenivorans]GLT07380.1 hypothetical protein GCM10007926_43180 [Sphingomonas psychrolutea]